MLSAVGNWSSVPVAEMIAQLTYVLLPITTKLYSFVYMYAACFGRAGRPQALKHITLKQKIKCLYIFYFRWRYSPLWALACRTIPLHFSLSITNSFHLLTPST
jgi:hypothetical protein